MNCPSCNQSGDRVTDKRTWEGNGLSGTKRRRECLHCGERWTTVEVTVIVTRGSVKLPNTLNDNGNGHKPAPKPKPQKPMTPKARELRKKLAMALHRARCKAMVIEGEELLHDPELADKPDKDTKRFEAEMDNA
jgi:hypothetical protein